MSKKRVLIAMSGGVDSSVTAFLLKREGYDCLGATMLLHGSADPGSCGSGSDADDAAAVARRLGFPHEVIDMRGTFERCVVDKFVRTYEAGRTPNPCIDCNRHLKFDALLSHARGLSCDYIATGHYARIRPLEDLIAERGVAHAAGCVPDAAPGTGAGIREAEAALLDRIARLSDGADTSRRARSLSYAADPAKDQSYVLYSLTQERLAHTLLPLGDLFKERDVRRIAREQGFANASKRDSQGICFVPENDFATYIERRRGEKLPEGDIVDVSGKVLGRHQGAIRYTVGQRKGLGVACAHPVYVTRVDAESNTVTLGEVEDLMAHGLVADDWIWSAPAQVLETLLDEAGDAGLPVSAKIRYRHPARPAHMRRASGACAAAAEGDAVIGAAAHGGTAVEIVFDEPERGIAPGQAVVVYAGGVVIGGGTTLRAIGA